jgi:hypothetical protein
MAVYPLLLLAMGFHEPREVAVLARFVRRGRREKPVAAPGEAAELAGELVPTMPDETEDVSAVGSVDEVSSETDDDDAGRTSARRNLAKARISDQA